MKKYCLAGAFCAAISVAIAAGAHARPHDMLKGNWEFDGCTSYNDGLNYGTYNFSFDGHGSFHTFIRYYQDSRCTGAVQREQAMAHGSYSIKYAAAEAAIRFAASLQFSHVDQPVDYEIVHEGHALQMCRQPGGPCIRYLRSNR